MKWEEKNKKNCNLVNRLPHPFSAIYSVSFAPPCHSHTPFLSTSQNERTKEEKKTYSTMKFNFLNCFSFFYYYFFIHHINIYTRVSGCVCQKYKELAWQLISSHMPKNEKYASLCESSSITLLHVCKNHLMMFIDMM
jgi:hypothetical protein